MRLWKDRRGVKTNSAWSKRAAKLTGDGREGVRGEE